MEEKISALRSIVQNVYKVKTLEEGVQIMETFLNGPTCPIRANEKHIMLCRVKQCVNLTKLQFFLTNSLLRYEGNRVLK